MTKDELIREFVELESRVETLQQEKEDEHGLTLAELKRLRDENTKLQRDIERLKSELHAAKMSRSLSANE